MRSFHLRAPESLFEKLERLATERGRSLNSEIRVRLEASTGTPLVELPKIEPPDVADPSPRAPAEQPTFQRPFRTDFKKAKQPTRRGRA